MIYLLKCGNCGTDSNVESDIPSMEWTCTTCGNLSVSSLPVEEIDKTKLLTEVGKGSLIALKAEDVVGEVVKSFPPDTKTKEEYDDANPDIGVIEAEVP